VDKEEEASLREVFGDAIEVRRVGDKDEALSALVEVAPMVCIYVGSAIKEDDVRALNCEYVSPDNWCLEYQFLTQLGKRLKAGLGPLGVYRFVDCKNKKGTS
jgi:hypothetical protein